MCVLVWVYLWGMCCVTSWWSSGRGERSCLHSGPASQGGWCCSPPRSDTWRIPPPRSDLREHNTDMCVKTWSWMTSFFLVQTLPDKFGDVNNEMIWQTCIVLVPKVLFPCAAELHCWQQIKTHHTSSPTQSDHWVTGSFSAKKTGTVNCLF